MQASAGENFGLSVATRAELDAMYERALDFQREDPRVALEPLHTDDFHVLRLHAF